MTPKQRSAHRNAQRSCLKGQELLRSREWRFTAAENEEMWRRFSSGYLQGAILSEKHISRSPDGRWTITFPTDDPLA